VNELKVGCHVVIELKTSETLGLKLQESDHSLAFILGALLAVEYLANLSRNTLTFLKSFKAMILGSNFI
jgi:hypothetical protein